MRPLFVLFSQLPTSDADMATLYIDSADTYSALESQMDQDSQDNSAAVRVVARFTGEQAAMLENQIQALKNGNCEDSDDQRGLIETTLLGFLFPTQEDIHGDDFDDDMDGDHESALASAGFGTEEDYGGDIDIDIDE